MSTGCVRLSYRWRLIRAAVVRGMFLGFGAVKAAVNLRCQPN